MASQIVKQNVGGLKYYTEKEKLMHSSNYFTNFLVGSMELMNMVNGDEIFIDRDGKLFEKILNFTRTNKLSSSLDDSMTKKIRKEAEFYQMSHLTEYINSMVEIIAGFSLIGLTDFFKKGTALINDELTENYKVIIGGQSSQVWQTIDVVSRECICKTQCPTGNTCEHEKVLIDRLVTKALIQNVAQLD